MDLHQKARRLPREKLEEMALMCSGMAGLLVIVLFFSIEFPMATPGIELRAPQTVALEALPSIAASAVLAVSLEPEADVTIPEAPRPTPQLPRIASFSASSIRPGGVSTLRFDIENVSEGASCGIRPLPATGALHWPGKAAWIGSTQSLALHESTSFTLSCANGEATTSVSVTAPLIDLR